MAIAETLTAKSPPLRLSADGVLLVGGTRVPLDTVIAAFEEGAGPEEIVLAYDSLSLADVYAVIGYYLQHRAEVAAYLREREQFAEEVRRQNEARTPMAGVRERLLARKDQQG
jgi:uncharacterized protein (DUF433 family)